MIVHRASEYGRCIRASVADRLGMKAIPVSERMEGLYARGNEHEEACVKAMAADGWLFSSEGQDLVTLEVADDVVVEGHLDGLGRQELLGDQVRVIEIKAPSTYASFERAYKTNDYSNGYMSRIAFQVSAYMVATGLECVMACLDGDTVKTFGIEVPIHSREEIVARVMEIEGWVAKGELPPDCSQVDWPCPFAYLHDPEIVTEVDNPELAARLSTYRKLALEGERIKKELKILRGPIDEMTLPAGKYVISGQPVTWYESTRTTLDKDAMVADGIDLSKYEKTSTTTGTRIGADTTET